MSRFGQISGSARREAWGTAVELDEGGLFRIRLDNSVGPLMVNTYVYRGPRELIVIDPGWPWTLDALEAALRDLGLARSFVDVDAWLYTHTHIDHMGPAALLSEISDAPHYVWSAVEPHVEQWHRFQNDTNDWTTWGYEAFADREFSEALAGRTQQRRDSGVEFLLEAHGEKPVRNLEYLELGEDFTVADLQLRFVDARGHDPYHAAFFESKRGWLFSGDVVIATPTPISAPMNDDLSDYLATLDRLESLPARLLLPGHGVQRAGNLSAAFTRSRDYQTQYRALVLDILERTSEPLGLLEIGLRSTPDGKPYEGGARWVVHLALLDSHIRWLVDHGRVARHDGPRYTRID